jgi:hypothetical protein
MGVVTSPEALSDAGWFTVTLALLLQPFASVMVKEYIPAARVKEPVPVYGAIPPAAETVTVALPPLQLMGVVTLAEALSDAGWFTVTLALLLQPFASVMVKEYVPAARVKVPVPVYGAVPPAAETVTVALPPLQLMGVVTEAVAINPVGSDKVAVALAVHPFASVMVKEYVPAARVKVPTPV